MLAAEMASFKEWEANTPYFDGCMPIEVMAERGRNTPRFGPMKPVGLTNPATGRRAWAVVQLRQDNALGSLWNMVGFQTKMKHAEQVRVFRMIPGLENAQFARLGGLHRNTFLNSPRVLDARLRLRAMPRLRSFSCRVRRCRTASTPSSAAFPTAMSARSSTESVCRPLMRSAAPCSSTSSRRP
jgi:methylenetetrahydrofolate--tRNA-(uracil-5-)-methyltransferase